MAKENNKIEFISEYSVDYDVINDITIDVNRGFYHYTTEEVVKKIINNGTFRLGTIGDSNDLEEKKRLKDKAKSVYILSFCNTQTDRVAMWLLYAGLDRGTALKIKPTTMKEIISEAKVFGIKDDNDKDGIELTIGKDVSLKYNWIIYKTNDKNKYSYRNEFKEDITISKNNYFVKIYPWECEQEFRIAVEIKKAKLKEQFKYIQLSFNKNLIKDFSIVYSPTYPEHRKASFEEECLSKGIAKNSISQSIIDYNLNIYKKSKAYIDLNYKE